MGSLWDPEIHVTLLCARGLPSCCRHIGKREDPGDEADIVPSIVIQTLRPNFKHLHENQVSFETCSP